MNGNSPTCSSGVPNVARSLADDEVAGEREPKRACEHVAGGRADDGLAELRDELEQAREQRRVGGREPGEVATAREDGRMRRGEHDAAHLVVVASRRERGQQLAEQRVGERVARVGLVERDRRNRVGDLVAQARVRHRPDLPARVGRWWAALARWPTAVGEQLSDAIAAITRLEPAVTLTRPTGARRVACAASRPTAAGRGLLDDQLHAAAARCTTPASARSIRSRLRTACRARRPTARSSSLRHLRTGHDAQAERYLTRLVAHSRRPGRAGVPTAAQELGRLNISCLTLVLEEPWRGWKSIHLAHRLPAFRAKFGDRLLRRAQQVEVTLGAEPEVDVRESHRVTAFSISKRAAPPMPAAAVCGVSTDRCSSIAHPMAGARPEAVANRATANCRVAFRHGPPPALHGRSPLAAAAEPRA